MPVEPNPKRFWTSEQRTIADLVDTIQNGINEPLLNELNEWKDKFDCLTDKYDELREFVRLITLQLQEWQFAKGKSAELFNYAYRMYAKHDVERRAGGGGVEPGEKARRDISAEQPDTQQSGSLLSEPSAGSEGGPTGRGPSHDRTNDNQ